jgi:hypothetical protein
VTNNPGGPAGNVSGGPEQPAPLPRAGPAAADAPAEPGGQHLGPQQPAVPIGGRWYRSALSELGLRDVFASLFVVLGTVVTLLPFLNLEGYGDAVVVTVDVLALLAVSMLLPAKTLSLPAPRAAVILVLVGVAVLVPAGGKLLFDRPAPDAVDVIDYDPFTLNGDVLPTLISTKMQGRCWTESLGDPRENSWRCMAASDGDIYDPCFSYDSSSNIVVCASAPWDVDVAQMTVSRLPVSRGVRVVHGRYPWAIELDNSVRCEIQQGAAGATDVGGVLYFCDDNQTDVFHVDLRTGTAQIGNVNGSHIVPAHMTYAWY